MQKQELVDDRNVNVQQSAYVYAMIAAAASDVNFYKKIQGLCQENI